MWAGIPCLGRQRPSLRKVREAKKRKARDVEEKLVAKEQSNDEDTEIAPASNRSGTETSEKNKKKRKAGDVEKKPVAKKKREEDSEAPEPKSKKESRIKEKTGRRKTQKNCGSRPRSRKAKKTNIEAES